MSRWQSILIGICLLVLPLTAIHAEDISLGKELHQESCLECHKPELYERADRTVKTLQHLRSQVLFCAVNNDVEWFDEEIDDVTAYLNAFYYLFGMK
jgi:mono/diheme cytochrome c family protein